VWKSFFPLKNNEKSKFYIGHSDPLHGFGLQPPRSSKRRISKNDQDAVEHREEKGESSEKSRLEDGDDENEEEEDDDDEEESKNDGVSAISSEELNSALSNALRISSLNVEQICALDGQDGGWKLIHRVGDSFCLYKRRLQLLEGVGSN
jgi:hypothetical protein